MDTTRYAQDARDIEEGARAEIEASDPRFDPDGTPVASSVAADRARRWTLRRHVTHYAPNGANGWCGRTVGFHTALDATRNPNRVTCRQCLASMRKFGVDTDPTFA